MMFNKMNNHNFAKDIRVDNVINSVLKIVINHLKNYLKKNLNSIVLGGSFGRGEGSYIIDKNNVRSNQSVPYRFSSLHDPNTPNVGFNNSDLKQDFLKKQQMSSRMISPAFPAAKP